MLFAQPEAVLVGTIEKMTKLEAGQYELAVKGEKGTITYVIDQPTVVGAFVQADQLEAGVEIFQEPEKKDGQPDPNIPAFLRLPEIPEPPKIQEIPPPPQIQKIPQPPKKPDIPDMKALQELQAKMQPPPSAPGAPAPAPGGGKPQAKAAEGPQGEQDAKADALAMMKQAAAQALGGGGAGGEQGAKKKEDEEPPPPEPDSLAKIETGQTPLSAATTDQPEDAAATISRPVFKKVVKVGKQADKVEIALASSGGNTEITLEPKQMIFKVLSAQDLKPGMKVKIHLVDSSENAPVQAVTVL